MVLPLPVEEVDYDAANRACAGLKPTGVFGFTRAGPMSGYSPIPATTIAVHSQPPAPTTAAPRCAAALTAGISQAGSAPAA